MGRSKGRKAGNSDNYRTYSTVGVGTPTTPGTGASTGYLAQPLSSMQKRRHGEMENRKLPTVSRGSGSLRQMHAGSPLQPISGNEAVVLKIAHLSNIAKWAAEAGIPSLGAFYGARLASTCQSAGIPSPLLSSQCGRCESVLLPGINFSLKGPVQTKKRRRGKANNQNKAAPVTSVVYHCHFCKYENQKRGNQAEQAQVRSAESHAKTMTKQQANLNASSATFNPATPAHAASKTFGSAGDPSIDPVTPAASIAGVFPINQDVASSGRKRKRKGWTGLRAIASSVQSKDFQMPKAMLSFQSRGDFTSPLNPGKRNRM